MAILTEDNKRPKYQNVKNGKTGQEKCRMKELKWQLARKGGKSIMKSMRG